LKETVSNRRAGLVSTRPPADVLVAVRKNTHKTRPLRRNPAVVSNGSQVSMKQTYYCLMYHRFIYGLSLRMW
jgi:hypothetical protein